MDSNAEQKAIDLPPSHGKPPLFASRVFSEGLTDSVRKRNERAARFSTPAEYKFRSVCMSSSDYIFRKISQLPQSLATNSTAENSSLTSGPTDCSGYGSDSSPPVAAPLPFFTENGGVMGREMIGDRDKSPEGESESEEKECPSSEEEAAAITSFEYPSNAGIVQSKTPAISNKISLTGYTSGDERPPRPTRGVGGMAHIMNSNWRSRQPRASIGPLGPSVEERKRALLRTLSATVAELEKMNVPVPEEIASAVSSAVSSVGGSSGMQDGQSTIASSFISISSVSSYSFSEDDGSETSGWQSPEPGPRRRPIPKRLLSDDDSSLPDYPIPAADVLSPPGQPAAYPTASRSEHELSAILDPSTDIQPANTLEESSETQHHRDNESKRPPEARKHTARSQSKRSRSRTQVRFDDNPPIIRIRTPDPEEEIVVKIPIPCGNLWNIATSTGMSYEGDHLLINMDHVYRSKNYIRYASEYQCASRGGHLDLSLASGMPEVQEAPVKKLKVPKVNGQRRWKSMARGGLYHLALWTNMTSNTAEGSPSSIFRTAVVPSDERERRAVLVRIIARLKKLKGRFQAKGSFYYLARETHWRMEDAAS